MCFKILFGKNTLVTKQGPCQFALANFVMEQDPQKILRIWIHGLTRPQSAHLWQFPLVYTVFEEFCTNFVDYMHRKQFG